jgi:Domain of unknown function (DUF4149)
MNRVLTMVCFTAAALWLGTGFYFFVFAANELFAALPVDTAGQAVGALFPTFFALCTILSAITLIVYVWIGRITRVQSIRYSIGLWSGVIGFLLNTVNQFYLLPQVQRIEAKMGPVSKAAPNVLKQFWMMHGISMLLELIALLAAAALFLVMTGSVTWTWGRKGELNR